MLHKIQKIYNWVIYKIINPSGRIYIGKTYNLKERLKHYNNGSCKNQKLLYRSIKKHGFISHKVEILEQFDSTESFANGKEMFWIRTYMSNVCKWGSEYPLGLNCTDGGEGQKGLKHSEETKRKLSMHFKANPPKGMLGRKLSNDQIAKRKKTMIDRYGVVEKKKYIPKPKRLIHQSVGRIPANKGIPMSDEQKKILSDKLKALHRVPYNKGVKFSGTPEEAKEKFGKQNIGRKNTPRKIGEEERRKMSERNKKPISVFDISGELIKAFPSIGDASYALGILPTSIWRILNSEVLGIKKYNCILKYSTQ